MSTEQHRQVENSEAAGEEHGSSDALDKKFQVRSGAPNIVINTQKKDQERWRQNCDEWVQRKIPAGLTQEFGGQQSNASRNQEREYDCNSAQPRQGLVVEVALVHRSCHPSSLNGDVSHEFGENERK